MSDIETVKIDFDLFTEFCVPFKNSTGISTVITSGLILYLTEQELKNNSSEIQKLKEQLSEFKNKPIVLEFGEEDAIKALYDRALTESKLNRISESSIESGAMTFFDEIIEKGLRYRATDIHLHLTDKLAIHYRVDKKMRSSLSESWDDQIGHRLFNAVMNTSTGGDIDHDKTQSKTLKREIDTSHGKVTLMLRAEKTPIYSDQVNSQALFLRLSKSAKPDTLEELNIDEPVRAVFRKHMKKNNGLVLVTGPTGSGKTTLLAGACYYYPSDKSLCAVEDPVERRLNYISPFITQRSEDKKNWDNALASILRQDPDSVMLGELRTLFQANLCIEASNTGHLVLSTLHTNSAVETINRLLNMGVELHDLLADGVLSLLVATKLAPKTCQCCALKYEELPANYRSKLEYLNPTPSQLEKMRFMNNIGPQKSRLPGEWNNFSKTDLECKNHCSEGTFGLEGVTEFLEMTPAIANFIRQNNGTSGLQELLNTKGFMSIQSIAKIKVLSGLLCPFSIQEDVADLLSPTEPDLIEIPRSQRDYYEQVAV